jgi:hypothetical protein
MESGVSGLMIDDVRLLIEYLRLRREADSEHRSLELFGGFSANLWGEFWKALPAFAEL